MNLYNEITNYLDQGQSENTPPAATGEKVFAALMQQVDYQAYTGIAGLSADQLKAIYGVTELARRHARLLCEKSPTLARIDHPVDDIRKVRQSLHSARKQMRQLAKAIVDRDKTIAALHEKLWREKVIIIEAAMRPSAPAVACAPAKPATPSFSSRCSAPLLPSRVATPPPTNFTALLPDEDSISHRA